MSNSGIPHPTSVVPPRASPVTFQDRLRKLTRGVVVPIATALGQWVDPNKLTVASVLPFVWALILLNDGHFQWAGVAIIFGGLFDVFDGAVARAIGKTTQFGAFLDSVTDRISDSLVFGGLAMYFAQFSDSTMLRLVLIGWIAAFTTSYIRACAQAVQPGLVIKVGILDRLMRMTLIVVCLLLNQPVVLTYILVILGVITVWQRVRYAMRTLE